MNFISTLSAIVEAGESREKRDEKIADLEATRAYHLKQYELAVAAIRSLQDPITTKGYVLVDDTGDAIIVHATVDADGNPSCAIAERRFPRTSRGKQVAKNYADRWARRLGADWSCNF